MQLRTGTKVTGTSGATYIVESFVNFGGQADIYRATPTDAAGDARVVAIKIYRDDWLQVDPEIMSRVRELVEERYHESLGLTEFVWPYDVIASDGLSGFVMNFVPANYVMLEQILEDGEFEFRIERLPLRAVTKIGALLADAFNRLHSEGIAYRDLNARNVMTDPREPTIAILDTEQSISNNRPVNIAGPASYRAPELWKSAYPSSATDRHSLAVIFFKLLMVGHPLEGALEPISIEDRDVQRRLYADEALFIFDPNDARNRPVEGKHDFPIKLWPALPEHVRALFTRTFTEGLKSPGRRVLENAWLPAFIRLYDSIVRCERCRLENFADPHEPVRGCYGCGGALPQPWRLDTGAETILLEPGSTLYRWQFDWEGERGRNTRVALVVQREAPPETGSRPVGLKNLGAVEWRARRANAPSGAEPETIAPGKILQLGNFTHVAFTPDGAFLALVAPIDEKVQA